MDRRIIELYMEYTHAPLPRRVFLERLAVLAGSSSAAMALLPLLDSNYARAASVPESDSRLAISQASYKGAHGEIRAYVAVPTSEAAKRPGVIVVHENRGLTPHIRDVVRRVALEGFTALGPDLLTPYGGTPSDEDKAREMFAKMPASEAYLDVVPAIGLLKSRPDATGKVGAIGFCFGGGVVNQLAEAAPDLDAAVAFYGPVPPLADVPKIRAKLQLHYAGNDSFVNPRVPQYEAALKAAGVRYEKYVYEGAEHGFHNDTAGARYDKPAAELAWKRTVAFLKANLA